MTIQIRTPEGHVLVVHTEVGEGVTRVIVEETPRQVESIEPQDAEVTA